MAEIVPFCYSPAGSMLVMGDGPELYVWSGQNDAPMWKQFTDGILVGVGATRNEVYSVDTDGRLSVWRGYDGQKQSEHGCDARASGLAVSQDGLCAVVIKDAVVLSDGQAELRRVGAPGVTAVGFGNGRGSLGVGSGSGTFQAIDTSTGNGWGSCTVGARITGVAWRAQGAWVVAAGTKVHLISPDGSQILASLDAGGATGPVACTADGALIAVVSGQDVFVLETAGMRRIGAIRYSRAVSGVGFGQDAWLGIGLDDNDANRVDLITGQMCKTEAHPGRTTNRWGFKVEVDPMVARQAVTTIRAGGKPIAEQVYLDGSGPGGGGGMSCLTMFLIALGIFFVCSGCSGVIALLWVYVYNA